MKQLHHSEKGSAIILVLLVLVMISMFGLAALNSSDTELLVSYNGRCFKQNIYRAESAVMEVSRIMETDTAPQTNLLPPTSTLTWISDGTIADPFNPEETDWTFGTDASFSGLFGDNNSGYTVVFEGLAPGASYNMNQPSQMWQYSVYGLSQLCNSQVGVVSGYRKRF